MRDDDCVCFLQWALPRLDLRWPGFRKVRRQVCRRIDRRIRELGLADVGAYRRHLETRAEEWRRLDSLCRITISRFNRDRGVFAALVDEVLPALAARARERDERTLSAWSAGCASGEEPYTLAILYAERLRDSFPDLELHIVATDADAHLLRRADDARYAAGTLKELPATMRERAFAREDDRFRLREEYRRGIRFLRQDIREQQPDGPFDLVLCRNLVFTYFEESLQRRMLGRLAAVLRDDGALVIGAHEALPEDACGFASWTSARGIFRKVAPVALA